MKIIKKTLTGITSNTTCIQVAHDQAEAMTMDNRVIMKDGFIEQIGTHQEVFNHPYNLFAAGWLLLPHSQ